MYTAQVKSCGLMEFDARILNHLVDIRDAKY